MESMNDREFEKQVTIKNKPGVGKPPTRLQKQAPSSLQLDSKLNSNVSSNSNNNKNNSTAIPLLSPLVLSPNPSKWSDELRFPAKGVNEKGKNEEKKNHSSLTTNGWHPAIAGNYVDSSSLLGMFQTKFLLVNDKQ